MKDKKILENEKLDDEQLEDVVGGSVMPLGILKVSEVFKNYEQVKQPKIPNPNEGINA